ncbi:VOC family protein [Pseudaestuariivita sp.]|uniref:VOC family protein n=1 Tax=Pseudaestuariivita sp. TaxID=2211669 RepID=UPI004058B263
MSHRGRSIAAKRSLRPHLMFQGKLAEALALWERAFPDMALTRLDDGAGPPASVEVQLAGQTFTAFDSPPVHDFDFTPSVSHFVACPTQEDAETLAAILGKDGTILMPAGPYDFAPWFTGATGVNWQIEVAK